MTEEIKPVDEKETPVDDLFETAQTLRLNDRQNYLMSWLVAAENQLRTFDTDAEKRFESVISTLHRERSRKVLPFKPRSRK